MKQKINCFNVWTKSPAKDKRNEDAIPAEENVQSPTNSAVAEAPTSSAGKQQSQPAPSAPPSTLTKAKPKQNTPKQDVQICEENDFLVSWQKKKSLEFSLSLIGRS